jgi:mannose-6-phosphate isomerase class I
MLIYLDMPRWEIQIRMRRHEISNLGLRNAYVEFPLLYKQAYFVDWRVLDNHKKTLMDHFDYFIDTTQAWNPKMISGESFRLGLELTLRRPFRVVPFFDPGPWGGQWLKEVMDLDRSAINYAWGFDCVPEENSLLLQYGDTTIEMPSINLVFRHPMQLLGEEVYETFGSEFPIRFDLLDTMNGGNLSLQVHPTLQYIREQFGMLYTQDESYYFLEAKEGACVYLGLRDDIEPEKMMAELQAAEAGVVAFDADQYVNKWHVKKHDHVLIPAGTIHCSGKDTVVLEVSATPYIFTFKLWDWGRLGLDGKPRPIHLKHGGNVLLWDRKESWTKTNLLNRIETIDKGDGWLEERTGLHETEFIETRRHWFTKEVRHHTGGCVNVLSLVEGACIVVESPTNAFMPFIVHYAETFIVPASIGDYTIRPQGDSINTCVTLKAFVRPLRQ